MAFAQIRKPEEEDYFTSRNKHIEEYVDSEPIKEIKIEPVDVVVDDMEEIHEGKKFARGLDTVIEVLEEEEKQKEDIYKEKVTPPPPKNEGKKAYW